MSLDNLYDRSISKLVYLKHRNGSISRVKIFARLEIIFDNLYISSTNLNLTVTGMYQSSKDTKKFIILPTSLASSSKFWLIVHVFIILVVAGSLAWTMFYMIKKQTQMNEKEAEELAKLKIAQKKNLETRQKFKKFLADNTVGTSDKVSPVRRRAGVDIINLPFPGAEGLVVNDRNIASSELFRNQTMKEKKDESDDDEIMSQDYSEHLKEKTE